MFPFCILSDTTRSIASDFEVLSRLGEGVVILVFPDEEGAVVRGESLTVEVSFAVVREILDFFVWASLCARQSPLIKFQTLDFNPQTMRLFSTPSHLEMELNVASIYDIFYQTE